MNKLIAIVTVTAAAALIVACSKSDADRTQGPAVSTPEAPGNAAVDTTPTAGDTAQTPGASSFTEDQARDAITAAGYSNVGPLTQDAAGIWRGKGTRGGAEVDVSVDYKGAINPQ